MVGKSVYLAETEKEKNYCEKLIKIKENVDYYEVLFL